MILNKKKLSKKCICRTFFFYGNKNCFGLKSCKTYAYFFLPTSERGGGVCISLIGNSSNELCHSLMIIIYNFVFRFKGIGIRLYWQFPFDCETNRIAFNSKSKLNFQYITLLSIRKKTQISFAGVVIVKWCMILKWRMTLKQCKMMHDFKIMHTKCCQKYLIHKFSKILLNCSHISY